MLGWSVLLHNSFEISDSNTNIVVTMLIKRELESYGVETKPILDDFVRGDFNEYQYYHNYYL